MDFLYELYNRVIDSVSTKFIRSLYDEVNWDARLISIIGSRGIGKTTMMLQYLKSHYKKGDTSALYISLDDPYFFTRSLIDTIDTFVKLGGEHLFIDEVHKYMPLHAKSDWSIELKAAYDRYPKLRMVYSGSSIIMLHKGLGDLSRRVSPYHMNGLSFREYLEFNNVLKYRALTIEEIVSDYTKLSSEISSDTVILKHFKEYLLKGYYAFYGENEYKYFDRLRNVLMMVLEVDIPKVMNIPFTSVEKMKKLLAVISSSAPYVPNLTKVGKNIGITDQRTFLKYLTYLEKAEIINTLEKTPKGSHILKKPAKVYLNNTNLNYALERKNSSLGTAREVFFYNQVSSKYNIIASKESDFFVDDKYTFEIGGKNKDFSQIADIDNAYLAIDDIEVGVFNKIPLWLFGFLY